MPLTKAITALCIAILGFALLLHGGETAEATSPWQIVCQPQKFQCQMAANLKTENGTVISVISLSKLRRRTGGDPLLIANMQIPLGLHIPSGITIRVDERVKAPAKLIECNRIGCRALFHVKDEILKAMQQGSSITITMLDAKSRKPLTLTYSLIGFSKIYDLLKHSG